MYLKLSVFQRHHAREKVFALPGPGLDAGTPRQGVVDEAAAGAAETSATAAQAAAV